jgi:hypothetical protein
VHDLTGGIPASGLFWTVQLPDDAFTFSKDGQEAVLRATDAPVIDTFQFGGPNAIPAKATFQVKWAATGDPAARGSGSSVAAGDPAAFSGSFRPARATGTFSVTESGFSFRSNPGASTDRSFAELGTEKNGSRLR